jgi:fructosamine-3-kinase
MTLPPAVVDWCRQEGHGAVTRQESVGGGCINNGSRLFTTGGATFFLKTNAQAPQGMFAAEAHGLEILRGAAGPRVPQALLWGDDFLLVEDLPPESPAMDFWPALGRRLAQWHDHTSPRFGFDQDNFIGSTPQSNPWTEDGHAFFAEHRLLYQARLAREKGLLTHRDQLRVESIARRLVDLVPQQPASLIHGDLWSGNVIAGPAGEACLIDPAAHYAWAEAELGMTELFGGFDPSFYESYVETRAPAPAWRERLPLYNLYHLLNHVNLFGGGYLAAVRRTLDRFA